MNKLSKDYRIKTEIKRLTSIFSDLDTNTMATIDGLIKRAAFMRVTLEDYEDDLNANGYVEMFTHSQSIPPYERERPVAKLYNAMSKNYHSLTKQLLDSLPPALSVDAGQEIREFLSR